MWRKCGHPQKQLIGWKSHQVNYIQLIVANAKLLMSYFQPVALEFRISSHYRDISCIRVEAKGQIQRASSICPNGNSGYTRPELMALYSGGHNHHEDNWDSGKNSVPKLYRKLQRRIDFRDRIFPRSEEHTSELQ